MMDSIKVKAMCLFIKDGKVLVSKLFDTVKKEYFYRVLGGHVDFFETAEDGVRREIREEVGSEIENLKLVDVVENLFGHEGKRGHEIVFLYVGDLARKELYDQQIVHILEDSGEKVDGEWVPIEKLVPGEIPLYPSYDYQSLFERL